MRFPVMKPSIVVLPLLILSEFEKTIARILCAESGRLGCSNEDSFQWPQEETQDADRIVQLVDLSCGDRRITRQGVG